MLCIKTLFYIVPPFSFSLKRFGTGDYPQQGRFSLSVSPNQSNFIASFNFSCSFLNNFNISKPFGNIFQLYQNFTGHFFQLKVDTHIWTLQFYILNLIQFIQSLLHTLSLCSLAGFCLKSFDKSFLLPNKILLIFKSLLLHFYPNGFLFLVLVIIARINM